MGVPTTADPTFHPVPGLMVRFGGGGTEYRPTIADCMNSDLYARNADALGTLQDVGRVFGEKAVREAWWAGVVAERPTERLAEEHAVQLADLVNRLCDLLVCEPTPATAPTVETIRLVRECAATTIEKYGAK